jgi:RNA polymerase sigma factor (sigma-70 family)
LFTLPFAPKYIHIMGNCGMTDEEIMQQLRAGGAARNAAWHHIYNEWRQYLHSIVYKMGGTKEDALNAISKVCIKFEDAVIAPDFTLKSSLKAYLGVSVRNAYLSIKESESKSLAVDSFDRNIEEALVEFPDFAAYDQMVQAQTDLIISTAVGEPCKTILRLFAERYSFREIGEKLGKSEDAAKEQKHACQKKIRAWLSQHPETKKYLKSLLHG